MTRVELVHAFLPETGPGGNLAGVVTEAADLSAERMQEVATKVGASETAFVLPSTRAELRLRFFTPRVEVPLCGHATLGAFHILAESGRFGADGIRRLTCETAAGILNVDVHMDEGKVEKVFLTMARPEVVVPRLMVGEVAPHLGLDRARIEKAGAPIQILASGIKALIVPVDTRESLARIVPSAGLSAFLEARKAHVLVAWTVVATRPQIRIAQRVFAPNLGIPEDPATGAAMGSLGAYLLSNHLVPGNAPVTTIRSEQGVEAGHPCALQADVHVDPVMNGFRPTKVKVGGRCRASGSMDL